MQYSVRTSNPHPSPNNTYPSSFMCSPYSLISPTEYAFCSFELCPNNSINVTNTDGAYCYGEQLLSLSNALNEIVGVQSPSSSTTINCASLIYTAPKESACQVYTLRQQCSNNFNSFTRGCSGRMTVAGFFPSQVPSPGPTIAPSTALTSSSFFCDPYAVTNTSSATYNFATCLIPNICQGMTISVGDCGNDCAGDQFIKLAAPNGLIVNENDNGGCSSGKSLCSKLSYTSIERGCISYTLLQGNLCAYFSISSPSIMSKNTE